MVSVAPVARPKTPIEQLRKPLATRLSPRHHERFIAIAAEQRRTVGSLAAMIIEEWIDLHDAPSKPRTRPR